MLEWIREHQGLMEFLVLSSAAMFVLSVVAVPWMLVRIPPRYFMTRHHEHPWADRHPLLRHSFTIVKNLIGLVLVAVGLLLLVLPGQGILTILAGLVLLDFPGKHRLLLWTISRPAVLAGVNWIRKRGGRAELVLPESAA